MSMKPILFSTPMVQAILDGRKTMTRRVVKPDTANQFDVCPVDGAIAYIDRATGDSYQPTAVAKYQPDDILWVCETWAKVSDWTDVDPCVGVPDDFIYRADWHSDESPKWKPSIFMPREAARIFLRVTDVRVERLQDITEADALAEGVEGVPCDHAGRYACEDCMNTGWIEPPSVNFMTLWENINAKRGYGWDNNPWVWVYTFERVEQPDYPRTVAESATVGEFIPGKEG